MIFEEHWAVIQKGVDKVINRIEGVDNSRFTSEEYMLCYTKAYNLCFSRREDVPKLLYEKYKKVFEDYINSMVLPSLREKKDELLLREMVRRWSNHKTMTRLLFRFFLYLDKYYIARKCLPTLEETSFSSFYDLVFEEMNKQVVDAVLSMVDQDCAGKQIDRTLVNNVLAIYLEIGDDSRKKMGRNLQKCLEDKAGASSWVTGFSS